jgi:hypothetical protein
MRSAADGRRALAKTLTELSRPLRARAAAARVALRRRAAEQRQGKLTQDALRALFAPMRRPTRPTARDHRARDTRSSCACAFLGSRAPRRSLPGSPVVAGAVQLHFAMRALEELLGAGAISIARGAQVPRRAAARDRRCSARRAQGDDRFAFSLRDAERRSARSRAARAPGPPR